MQERVPITALVEAVSPTRMGLRAAAISPSHVASTLLSLPERFKSASSLVRHDWPPLPAGLTYLPATSTPAVEQTLTSMALLTMAEVPYGDDYCHQSSDAAPSAPRHIESRVEMIRTPGDRFRPGTPEQANDLSLMLQQRVPANAAHFQSMPDRQYRLSCSALPPLAGKPATPEYPPSSDSTQVNRPHGSDALAPSPSSEPPSPPTSPPDDSTGRSPYAQCQMRLASQRTLLAGATSLWDSGRGLSRKEECRAQLDLLGATAPTRAGVRPMTVPLPHCSPAPPQGASFPHSQVAYCRDVATAEVPGTDEVPPRKARASWSDENPNSSCCNVLDAPAVAPPSAAPAIEPPGASSSSSSGSTPRSEQRLSRSVTPNGASRRLGSLATLHSPREGGTSGCESSLSRPPTPGGISSHAAGDCTAEPASTYRACRAPASLDDLSPRAPDTGVCLAASAALGRRACPYRADIPTRTCAMAPSTWFAPAEGTDAISEKGEDEAGPQQPKHQNPNEAAAQTASAALGLFSPAGVVCGAAGPAWTRGEVEPPQGMRCTNNSAAAIYTPEQQARLGVASVPSSGRSSARQAPGSALSTGEPGCNLGAFRPPEVKVPLSTPRQAPACSWLEPSDTVGIPEWFLYPKDPGAVAETALAEIAAAIAATEDAVATAAAEATATTEAAALDEVATDEVVPEAKAAATELVTELATALATAPCAELVETQVDGEAPSPFRMPRRAARVSATATSLLALETQAHVGPIKARSDQKGGLVKRGKRNATSTSGGGLAALAKLQAAGRTVTNTIKVKQIFVPPPAPSTPTMWATIKNEHLLVATFWSADANYAKVQKGQSQLRETQLVQIVFNTLMFQLSFLSLLAWCFTDFDTVLTGPMIFAAGTLAAFASAAFTLLCKGVFRWGNTRRWNVRKGNRLRRFSQWMRSAAKSEGGVQVAVMKEWWHYRTSSLRRTPKQALPRMAVVVRQNLS